MLLVTAGEPEFVGAGFVLRYVPFAVGEAIADEPVPTADADDANADVAKRARKRKGRMVRVIEDDERAIVWMFEVWGKYRDAVDQTEDI